MYGFGAVSELSNVELNLGVIQNGYTFKKPFFSPFFSPLIVTFHDYPPTPPYPYVISDKLNCLEIRK